MNFLFVVIRKVFRVIKNKTGLYFTTLFYHPKTQKEISVNEAGDILSQYYTPQNLSLSSQAAKDSIDLDLSIIIPVYNGEKYLNKCLNSVLNQNTNYSYEVICVNDGSTDNSESILKEHDGERIFRYINKQNGGISSARNCGIKLSAGRYLMFIDNDDYIADDYIETMLSNALKNNADIVKCGYNSVSTDTVKKAYIEGKSKVINCEESSDIFSYNGFCWGMLIKRNLFSNACFPEGYWYEDMITRLILYPQCKVFSYVSQPLYYYRIHGNNASSVVWKSGNYKSFDQYYLTKTCMDWLTENGVGFSTSLCLVIQYELCNMLFTRTLQLEDNIKKCLFVLACDTNDKLLNLCPEYKKSGNLTQRRLTSALINRDYNYWKRICRYLVV